MSLEMHRVKARFASSALQVITTMVDLFYYVLHIVSGFVVECLIHMVALYRDNVLHILLSVPTNKPDSLESSKEDVLLYAGVSYLALTVCVCGLPIYLAVCLSVCMYV